MDATLQTKSLPDREVAEVRRKGRSKSIPATFPYRQRHPPFLIPRTAALNIPEIGLRCRQGRAVTDPSDVRCRNNGLPPGVSLQVPGRFPAPRSFRRSGLWLVEAVLRLSGRRFLNNPDGSMARPKIVVLTLNNANQISLHGVSPGGEIGDDHSLVRRSEGCQDCGNRGKNSPWWNGDRRKDPANLPLRICRKSPPCSDHETYLGNVACQVEVSFREVDSSLLRFATEETKVKRTAAFRSRQTAEGRGTPFFGDVRQTIVCVFTSRLIHLYVLVEFRTSRQQPRECLESIERGP